MKKSKPNLEQSDHMITHILKPNYNANNYQNLGKTNTQTVDRKSGFVSHTKLTAEATFMDLFHL